MAPEAAPAKSVEARGAQPAAVPQPNPECLVEAATAAAEEQSQAEAFVTDKQISLFKTMLEDALESQKKELLHCMCENSAHQEIIIESLLYGRFAAEFAQGVSGDEEFTNSPKAPAEDAKLLRVLPSGETPEQQEPTVLMKRQSTYELAKAKSHAKERHIVSRPVPRKCLAKFVRSSAFEAIVAVLIVSNSLLIGIQVQYAAEHLDQQIPAGFNIAQTTYSVLFLIELILRIIDEGTSFFTDIDNVGKWGWNMLDLFVVTTSVLEISVNFLSPDTSTSLIPTTGLRILRVVRVTRLIRVIRIVRVVRFIRALRTLVYSIFCTLRSLVWSMFLLVLIMYVFSIVLTDTVITEVTEKGYQANPFVLHYFGSVHLSMQTLFKSLTGGLTWNEALDPLVEQSGWLYGAVFLVYIAFCYFAVLNVMTGVFCHSAIRSAERDHELAIQAIHQDRSRYVEMVMKIFSKIDVDSSGSVSILEFEKGFNDREVRAMLTSLELDAHDAWTLFRALDFDGDNLVLAEEFLDGCLSLKGSAKAVDLANFRKDIKSYQTNVENLLKDVLSMTSDLMGEMKASRKPSKRQTPSRTQSSSSHPQLGVTGPSASQDGKDQERDSNAQSSALEQDLPGSVPEAFVVPSRGGD